ncbi:MAG: STAS domain-containing protein [Planctomycetota bacterium]
MSKRPSCELVEHESHLSAAPTPEILNRRETAAEFTSDILEMLRRESQLTELFLDLSQLTWISSAALNELIRLQTDARGLGVGIRIHRITDAVREVFQVTRLERSFRVDQADKSDDSMLEPIG